jgi:hypothetical protein
MLELRYGAGRALPLDACAAAVKNLEQGAAQVEDRTTSRHLATLAERLAAFAAASNDDAERDRLLAAYADVAALDRAALGLEAEHDRREPIIVRSLLLQVEEVRGIALGKLYLAGLGRLGSLLAARADDIASTTGLPAATANAVAESVAAYRRSFALTTASADPRREHQELGALVDRLAALGNAYEAASARFSDAAYAERRRLRGERTRLLLQIDLLLARVGECDRVARLERMAVQKRIGALRELLSDETVFPRDPKRPAGAEGHGHAGP